MVGTEGKAVGGVVGFIIDVGELAGCSVRIWVGGIEEAVIVVGLQAEISNETMHKKS